MRVALLASASLMASAEMTFARADNTPKPTNLTERHSGVIDKRVPIQRSDIQRNERVEAKRFPMKQWHAEFNSIGKRRAPIDMKESQQKTMIQPNVIDMKTFDRKIAPQSGKMADVRNFDFVKENRMVEEYQDAEVVTVEEMSRPASPNEGKEISMRDLNRFSFQRNHPDTGGSRVQRTASEEEE